MLVPAPVRCVQTFNCTQAPEWPGPIATIAAVLRPVGRLRLSARAVPLAAALLCSAACGAAVPAGNGQPAALCPTAPPSTPDRFDRPSSLRTVGGGVQLADLTPGCGALVEPERFVIFDYTAWLANGREFDTSHQASRRPLCVQVGSQLPLPGFAHAFDGMRAGGLRRVVIPPELGFGSQGAPPVVPPDSRLVIDVLVDKVSLATDQQTACAG
jgi:FKBP-type peptidyl-prolyl cis-trans isomerase